MVLKTLHFESRMASSLRLQTRKKEQKTVNEEALKTRRDLFCRKRENLKIFDDKKIEAINHSIIINSNCKKKSY